MKGFIIIVHSDNNNKNYDCNHKNNYIYTYNNDNNWNYNLNYNDTQNAENIKVSYIIFKEIKIYIVLTQTISKNDGKITITEKTYIMRKNSHRSLITKILIQIHNKNFLNENNK